MQQGGTTMSPPRRQQLSVKITDETCERFRRLARAHGLTLGDLFEQALDAWQARHTAEQPLDDDAGHPRAHLGNTRRRDTPGQFAHDRARLRLDGDDADFGRGFRHGDGRSRGLRLIAAGEQRRCRREHEQNAGLRRSNSLHGNSYPWGRGLDAKNESPHCADRPRARCPKIRNGVLRRNTARCHTQRHVTCRYRVDMA